MPRRRSGGCRHPCRWSVSRCRPDPTSQLKNSLPALAPTRDHILHMIHVSSWRLPPARAGLVHQTCSRGRQCLQQR